MSDLGSAKSFSSVSESCRFCCPGYSRDVLKVTIYDMETCDVEGFCECEALNTVAYLPLSNFVEFPPGSGYWTGYYELNYSHALPICDYQAGPAKLQANISCGYNPLVGRNILYNPNLQIVIPNQNSFYLTQFWPIKGEEAWYECSEIIYLYEEYQGGSYLYPCGRPEPAFPPRPPCNKGHATMELVPGL